ncbi:S1/P1 nuclease [Sphingomonas sp. RB56-2]|uniref:S1/P1 nuclease n=1 Tax=Sphingomonas brevis TaxID=2908206 RepID=A0ABT0SAR0_9SPHN|nr:S1/P1 nuclease [Sphingomonas brevis]MCL6741506.1 S1/P1 nuclease [Sphingomonas brevis]
MPNQIIAALGGLLALFAFAAPAQAYWEYGHESVARIAWLQMRPDSRARVAALLRQGRLLETPGCPVATLEQASVWADCIKPLGDRFAYAYSWHYQNVDVCKPFDLKSACKDGNCVSAQIERNARLLADRQVPVRERLMALAFLTHFVGDLHQPMHAGDHADLGGNKVAATYGIIAGRTNLHSIWDGWLAERAISTPPGGPAELLAQVSAADRERIAGGSVEDWSREMWAKARDLAYQTLVGDPCGAGPVERPVMDEAKVRALIPEVRQDVVEGGIRLARLIDDALGPEARAPGQKR